MLVDRWATAVSRVAQVTVRSGSPGWWRSAMKSAYVGSNRPSARLSSVRVIRTRLPARREVLRSVRTAPPIRSCSTQAQGIAGTAQVAMI
jgi:hypothetical protein